MAETVEPVGSQPLDGVDVRGLIDRARAEGLSLAIVNYDSETKKSDAEVPDA